MKKLYEELRVESRWLPGTNSSLNFWSANWLGEPLISSLNILESIGINLSVSFSDFWNNGWAIPSEIFQRFPTLLEKIASYYPSPTNSDKLIWSLSSNGDVTSKAIFQDYMRGGSSKLGVDSSGEALSALDIPYTLGRSFTIVYLLMII